MIFDYRKQWYNAFQGSVWKNEFWQGYLSLRACTTEVDLDIILAIYGVSQKEGN